MKQKVDWIIHCCENGACDECGRVETNFLPYTCNAHTHGMERYEHMDFQMVLHLGHREIMRILNTLGLRVQAGERFKDGDMVAGIYEDCNIRLTKYIETGRWVLRVIIPDKYNVFPEDDHCMETYRLQLLKTDALCPSDRFWV
ncbi:hypothetical protein DS742_25350 [Lacrimispora amygdalina]|uniref:DUF4262 domain-containing protein n=1 Tax=Lacrimispora amygdalina TaxID=253257 RepID=A0A3E2N525_9FIRM|nr:hypothetical protein [Clostridium indicum]RFZ76103.1 hypothetical protein DS742_25350 [Clostridium indicum]